MQHPSVAALLHVTTAVDSSVDSEMSIFSGRRSICVFSLQAVQSIHYQHCVATHAALKQALPLQ